MSLLSMVLLSGILWAGSDDPVQDQSEPPVRLKKKIKSPAHDEQGRPRNPDQKPGEMPGKSESPKTGQPRPGEHVTGKEQARDEDPEQRIKEIMERVSKNLHTAQQRLGKKDSGDATQQVQRDIVKDLEELIEQTARQQQQNEQRQGSGSSAGSQKQRSSQTRGSNTQPRSSAQRPKQSPMPQGRGKEGNNPREGKRQQDELSRIADLYKDIWGHLPLTLRQEMEQYSREQFMPKYQDLLKQYYATIAEKGRKKGDESR
jgi:hypothetical protein